MNWEAFWLTVRLAAIVSALLVAIGIPIAYWLTYSRWRWKFLVEAAVALPIVLPPTVLGYYLLVVLGRHGVIGGWLHNQLGIDLIFTWQASVIAAAVAAFPLTLRAASAAFAEVDLQLEHAARTLGQNETQVFLRITLPLAWRGVLSGALLAFARAMGEFGATLMVAGSLPGRTQTLSIAIYNAVMAGDDDAAQGMVLLSLIAAVVVLILAARLLRRRDPQ